MKKSSHWSLLKSCSLLGCLGIIFISFLLLIPILQLVYSGPSTEEINKILGISNTSTMDAFRFSLNLKETESIDYIDFPHPLYTLIDKQKQVITEKNLMFYDKNFKDNSHTLTTNNPEIEYSKYFFTIDSEYIQALYNKSNMRILKYDIPISDEKKNFIKSLRNNSDIIYCTPFTDTNFVFINIGDNYYVLNLENQTITYEYICNSSEAEPHFINIYNDTFIHIKPPSWGNSSYDIYDVYGNLIETLE